MAVTFLQQPTANSIQSSDDPLVYVFQSNQFGQQNFSFVVQVQYAGGIIEEHMIFPERPGGIAQFDASRSVMNLVPKVRRTSTLYYGEYLPTLNIRVIERYGATPTNASLTLSSICKLVKASTDEETFQPGWLPAKYTPSLKWLTNHPNNTTILERGNPLWCSILNTDPQTLVEVFYEDAQGNVLGTGTSGVQPDYDHVTVYLDNALMTSHVAPNSLSDVHVVRIYLNQSEGYSVIFSDEECGEPTQLSWRNNIGGHDQFSFTHNRERRLSTETREYKKQFGRWKEDPIPGNYYEFRADESGPTHYLKTTDPAGSIHSGWISDHYQNWLAEIYQSIDVIAVLGSTIERISVTDTQITLDKNRFSDPLNFTVNYKKSNFKSING